MQFCIVCKTQNRLEYAKLGYLQLASMTKTEAKYIKQFLDVMITKYIAFTHNNQIIIKINFSFLS